MATVIRFARHGRKKAPYYRIVVQDSRVKRGGRFIEHIGAFDPLNEEKEVKIDRARLEYWLGAGAQMSDAVRGQLSIKLREWAGASIVPRKPKPVKVAPAPVVEAAAPAEAAPEAAAEDKPATEEKPSE